MVFTQLATWPRDLFVRCLRPVPSSMYMSNKYMYVSNKTHQFCTIYVCTVQKENYACNKQKMFVPNHMMIRNRWYIIYMTKFLLVFQNNQMMTILINHITMSKEHHKFVKMHKWWQHNHHIVQISGHLLVITLTLTVWTNNKSWKSRFASWGEEVKLN